MNTAPSKADYFIEIKYERASESPSRVFKTMSELIESFQQLDRSLIASIDSHIEPVLLLEDIESGSVKSYFSTFLKSLDDDGIKELSLKKLIGAYLVKGKYRIINFLDNKTTITNVKEIKELQEDLLKIASETNVNWLPYYTPLDTRQLLLHIQQISISLSHLDPIKDSAKYVTNNEEAQFNLKFNITPESLKELITNDTIISKNELILKVKKPDYLGDSMWDFRFGDRNITAKVLDKEWVGKFQSRQVDIRPGDSVKAMTTITHLYDSDNNLSDTIYEITKIIDVIPVNFNQLKLLGN